MSPTDQMTQEDTTVRLALIEKDLSLVHGIFQRLETTLEKISEASSQVQKLLAVHDQRIDERERAEAALFESIERRKDEYARGVEKVSQKMEEMTIELKQQVREEMAAVKNQVAESLKQFQESQKDHSDDFDALEERVSTLEKWRWMMVGGGAVVGFIIGQWPLVKTFLGAG